MIFVNLIYSINHLVREYVRIGMVIINIEILSVSATDRDFGGIQTKTALIIIFMCIDFGAFRWNQYMLEILAGENNLMFVLLHLNIADVLSILPW